MNLADIIKETEQLGITVLFCNMPKTIGRYTYTNGKYCIFIHNGLTDTEKINVLLHERSHFLNDDLTNHLYLIPSYAQRIESQAEEDRILDFMNLVNSEYPIDEHFNYVEYMKNASISPRYENLVKKTAQSFFNANKK